MNTEKSFLNFDSELLNNERLEYYAEIVKKLADKHRFVELNRLKEEYEKFKEVLVEGESKYEKGGIASQFRQEQITKGIIEGIEAEMIKRGEIDIKLKGTPQGFERAATIYTAVLDYL